MLMFSRRSLRARVLLLLGIAAIAVAVVPPQAGLAAIKQNMIDNSVAQFSRGVYQRTALGTLTRTDLSSNDQAGALQLGPIGLLKSWLVSPFTLKKKLFRMGATSIGNRIYIIGGSTPVSGSSYQPVADVWSAAVSQSTGQFVEDWQAEPPLPRVVGSNQTDFKLPVAAVNSTAVVTGTFQGGRYIYAIGGNTSQPGSTIDFSSFAVRIGVVGADGHIATWLLGPPLPDPTPLDAFADQFGAQSAAAVRYVAPNGTNYIYLIGGLTRYRQGGGNQLTMISEGLKTVFYARVGSGGQLFKPSNPNLQGWDRMTNEDIPIQDPAQGVWDATAMSDHYVVSTGVSSSDMIYLVGGQTLPEDQTTTPTFSSVAYRAFINSNGTIAWDKTWQGTLPQPRNGLSGVTFRGSLYVVGGLPNGASEPDKGVLTSYVEDNMKLHQFNAVPPPIQGGGSNFLKSDMPSLPPRTFHATAVVPANSSTANSGFVYVFGGRGNTKDGDPSDDQGSSTVLYGKIGGSEDTATSGYVSDAWYFSKPFDINYTGAQLQTIYWAAAINRTGANPDIQLWYRVSSDSTCANPGWTDAAWKLLDATQSDATHASVHGQNSSQPINLAARCFQYKAQLKTDNFLVTPSLLNVSISIIVPGSPDLSPKLINPLRGPGNALTGLEIVIQNINRVETTLPADFETAYANDSFYVDLCIFKPGQAIVVPPLPWSDTTPNKCSTAFAEVTKRVMGANVTYTINQWWDAKDDHKKNGPVKLTSYFKQPGTYYVVVAVDSYNFVPESSTRGGKNVGETNNLSAVTRLDVPRVGTRTTLPLIRRSR